MLYLDKISLNHIRSKQIFVCKLCTEYKKLQMYNGSGSLSRNSNISTLYFRLKNFVYFNFFLF
jgi:hypothetical protein